MANYYNPDNYEHNPVDANGTVVLCNPTQRPGSSSFMMSESYDSQSVEEWDNSQRSVAGVNHFEPYPPVLEEFSAAGGSTVQVGGFPVPLWTLPLPLQRVLVPQRKYSIRANNRRGFNPEPRIQFDVGNQSGMSLQDAMDERYEGLVGRDDGMFIGCDCTAISLRIEWPEYKAWNRHINTVDWKRPRGPITRSKLAFKIAKIVDSFIKSNQATPIVDQFWRVGNGRIELKDLVLDSIEHVTKGSWQPQLFLMRPFS